MDYQFTFTGTVNEISTNQTITQINQIISQGLDKLYLYISSTGGDMDSGFRLYDYLRSIPTELTTIGFGQVSSAAVTIFLAGEHRICTRGCQFFLHEGSYSNTYQNAGFDIIKESNLLLDNSRKKTIETISQRTGKTISQVSKIVKVGKLLSANQAKKFGIVNNIVDKLPLFAPNPPPQIIPSLITPNNPQTSPSS